MLSRYRIALSPSGGSSCIMSGVIWSRPGAFRGWRCLITPFKFTYGECARVFCVLGVGLKFP
jgi:hypothetical protein